MIFLLTDFTNKFHITKNLSNLFPLCKIWQRAKMIKFRRLLKLNINESTQHTKNKWLPSLQLCHSRYVLYELNFRPKDTFMFFSLKISIGKKKKFKSYFWKISLKI